MRHFIHTWFLVAALLLATGCGSLFESAGDRRANEARIAGLVQERLDARQFKVLIQFMYPPRGGSRAVNNEYSVTVDGEKLISHLPYMGVAYNVPYGGGKVFSFEDEIEEYIDGRDDRGRRIVTFSTDNGEDYIIYYFTIFDNGKADLLVRSKNREDITYRGFLDPDAYPIEEKD